MKFIKKDLMAIPIEPYPRCGELDPEIVLVMTAKLVVYQGERLLVATFYDTRSRAPYLRVFCNRARWLNWLIGDGEWNERPLENIPAPRAGKYHAWSVSNPSVTAVADEKSARQGKRYFHGGAKNTLEDIVAFQRAQRSQKQEVRESERREITDRIMAMFPPLPDVEAGILDTALWDSRYLFYHRTQLADPLTGMKDTVYHGYCTHCRHTSELDWIPKHKEAGCRCPVCGSVVETRAEGLGRKRMQDYGSCLVFDRDAEGNVYGWYLRAERDYSGDVREVKTEMWERERYFFGRGSAYKFVRKYEFSTPENKWTCRWAKQQRGITEPAPDGVMYNQCRDYYIALPLGGFAGTVLDHAHLEDYLIGDAKRNRKTDWKRIGWKPYPMGYLSLWYKHPGVEHLVTQGLHAIVEDILEGAAKAKELNFNGRRPRDILGVSQPELEMLAAHGADAYDLHDWKRLVGALNRPADADDLEIIMDLRRDSPAALESMLEDGTIDQVSRYLRRQMRRNPGTPRRSYRDVWIMLQDYRRDCKRLKISLKDPETAYPHDLLKAHDRTVELVRQAERIKVMEKEKKEQKKYAARLAALAAYEWADPISGLCIRAARSRAELVEEGQNLKHCVGGYAERHLAGETTIFFIRRIDDPGTSYYTLEFRDGEIRQNRGYKNDEGMPKKRPPAEVREFARRWYEQVARPIWEKEQRKAKKQQARINVAVA